MVMLIVVFLLAGIQGGNAGGLSATAGAISIESDSSPLLGTTDGVIGNRHRLARFSTHGPWAQMAGTDRKPGFCRSAA
jgi:hypothetical protein